MKTYQLKLKTRKQTKHTLLGCLVLCYSLQSIYFHWLLQNAISILFYYLISIFCELNGKTNIFLFLLENFENKKQNENMVLSIVKNISTKKDDRKQTKHALTCTLE